MAMMKRAILLSAILLTGCYKDEWRKVDSLSIKVSLSYPQANEVLDNGCYNIDEGIHWSFGWQPIAGAQSYNIYVKHANAPYATIDEEVFENTYNHNLSSGYIMPQNLYGWTWKVRAFVNNRWQPWSDERPFEVEPADTDC